MSKSRLINTNFWKDNYVSDLDPTEKLLFNYLFTNPLTTIAGIYEISTREIAFDCGIDKDMVLKVIQRFENDGKLTYRHGWMFLHNAVRHQSLNPSIIRGIERVYNDIPVWLRELVTEVWVAKNMDRLLGGWVQPVTASPQPGTPNLIESNLIESNLIESNASADKPAKRERPETIAKDVLDELHAYWNEKLDYEIEGMGNRQACAWLVRKYKTPERVKQLIDGVAKAQTDRYAPRIGDFSGLKRKHADLVAWGRQDNRQTNTRKVGKVS